MARTDRLFRMVLVSHEGVEAGDTEGVPSDWVVSAVYKQSRGGRKVSATLSAENLVTGEVLHFPRDADKIVAVLPQEFWPSFITDLISSAVPESQGMLV